MSKLDILDVEEKQPIEIGSEESHKEVVATKSINWVVDGNGFNLPLQNNEKITTSKNWLATLNDEEKQNLDKDILKHTCKIKGNNYLLIEGVHKVSDSIGCAIVNRQTKAYYKDMIHTDGSIKQRQTGFICSTLVKRPDGYLVSGVSICEWIESAYLPKGVSSSGTYEELLKKVKKPDDFTLIHKAQTRADRTALMRVVLPLVTKHNIKGTAPEDLEDIKRAEKTTAPNNVEKHIDIVRKSLIIKLDSIKGLIERVQDPQDEEGIVLLKKGQEIIEYFDKTPDPSEANIRAFKNDLDVILQKLNNIKEFEQYRKSNEPKTADVKS